MRVSKLRITLPPGSGPLAGHEARHIAEAVGRALAAGEVSHQQRLEVRVPGLGRRGSALAGAVGTAVSKRAGERRGD